MHRIFGDNGVKVAGTADDFDAIDRPAMKTLARIERRDDLRDAWRLHVRELDEMRGMAIDAHEQNPRHLTRMMASRFQIVVQTHRERQSSADHQTGGEHETMNDGNGAGHSFIAPQSQKRQADAADAGQRGRRDRPKIADGEITRHSVAQAEHQEGRDRKGDCETGVFQTDGRPASRRRNVD
ncbi:hypothetical protein GGD83_004102 [Rhodoblastus sphagnicola]|uniref:hypothetical protein n=1 Tax=Rhodoblastus sphagnicola TaxID=333368 RepID=UPI001304BBF4|nr:hypothetical protein [Rhodoblastus sphagnicola]MBB4200273.1 hypothetical protein [Rhodoblastus sphagnicola]